MRVVGFIGSCCVHLQGRSKWNWVVDGNGGRIGLKKTRSLIRSHGVGEERKHCPCERERLFLGPLQRK
jgi:hypothetical protein